MAATRGRTLSADVYRKTELLCEFVYNDLPLVVTALIFTVRCDVSSPGRPVTRRRKRVQQRNFYQPGIRALMEIRKYQNSTALLIQRLSFARLVREVCTKYSCGRSYLWQSSAITALQEAAEAFLVQLFEDSHLCSLKAKRVTLRAEDIQFTLRIRGDGLG
ncbi:histone H3-like centromeric protein A [Phyllobates terribilis]|uniref:histone H3-like centromeric protein A n=1 Tax=Phyllobates terribilis TaxID=111132 RepID=UPI003CCABFA7